MRGIFGRVTRSSFLWNRFNGVRVTKKRGKLRFLSDFVGRTFWETKTKSGCLKMVRTMETANARDVSLSKFNCKTNEGNADENIRCDIRRV